MKRRKIKISFRLFGAIATILLALSFLMGYIWRVATTSEYFKIKDILVRDSRSIDLSYLKGKDIFSVDLAKESRSILRNFPDCRSVRIVRLLPDRIFVDFIRRNPVAYVKLYKYFTIDQEGVLFYTQGTPQDSQLPVITGLETKIFGPKPGKKYDLREVKLSLNILKEARKNRALRSFQIRSIDVSNPVNLSIILASSDTAGIEVKLGEEFIRDKIILLGALLGVEKKNLGNIKYIDLRFKEPLIKLNDVKAK